MDRGESRGMNRLLLSMLLVLTTGMAAWADPSIDAIAQALRAAGTGSDAEILFLQKTTTFNVPEHSQKRLTAMTPYGGAKFAYTSARDMINFFEKNGYPGLRAELQSGGTTQLDQIAQNFSFNYVYEGPDNDAAWNNFKTYSAQIVDEVYHWGWLPKSGQAFITVVTTPKAAKFSATSDGKHFKVLNPVSQIPTSQWSKSVKPVFDKFGKPANRI